MAGEAGRQLDVVFWCGDRIFLNDGSWYEEDRRANARGHWRWSLAKQRVIATSPQGNEIAFFTYEVDDAYLSAIAKSVVE